jgi:diguanylate cyclase (GGDEF)-like protein
VDWVEKLKHKYNVDVLYDVFLRENDSLFFLIEESHDICDKPLIKLFGTCEGVGLPYCVDTIDELLSHIDVKSQICDIRGANEYRDELHREINSDQTKFVLYLPLDFKGTKRYLQLEIIKMFKRNISIVMLNQIDIKKVNVETLFFESYKDSLTNLFNFSTLLMHIDKTEDSHYFGFLDLDYFKVVNDTYGHKVGDEILAKVGWKLIEIADETVIMYRKSGDEFIFMTLGLDLNETKKLVKRIQKAIRSVELPDIKIDCSIGVAEYRHNNGFYDAEDAVNIADVAMYVSKSTGRGRVTYFNEEQARKVMASGPLEKTLELLESRAR